MRRKIYWAVVLAVLGWFIWQEGKPPSFSFLKRYNFEAIRIEAAVLPDGSMQVVERRTASFSGSFSRMYLDIPVRGFKELTDVRVFEDGRPYTPTKISDGRPDGHYAVSLQNNTYHIEWYFRTDGGRRTFNVSYRVVDCVRVHKDVAELYWQFIGDRWQVGTKNAAVALRLPPGAGEGEVRAWGHGPLQGTVNVRSPQEVVWQVKNQPPGRFLEGRVVFPPRLVPLAGMRDEAAVLPAILSQEQGWQEKAAGERRRLLLTSLGGAGLAALVLFFAGFVYLRWGKRYRPELAPDYYRELPGDYSPAVADVLINKKTKPAALAATLMDLARRGHLQLAPVQTEVRRLGGLLGKKEKEDVLVRRLKSSIQDAAVTCPGCGEQGGPQDKFCARCGAALPPAGSTPAEKLTPHEKMLLDFFFNTVGGAAEEVSFSRLKAFTRRYPRVVRYFWNGWESELKRQAGALGFFDRAPRPAVWGGALLAAAAAITGIFLLKAGPVISLTLFPSAAAAVLALAGTGRRSRYGEDQLALWQAFRRFLKNFSSLDRAT
ncbi:MAG: DUF2207 domain-containing protein, partial [Firmicutes bacterium]|nr:DUF2207 domain-containing protein [Bacillota bacterium]